VLGCTGITRKCFDSPNSPAPAGTLGKGPKDGQRRAEAAQQQHLLEVDLGGRVGVNLQLKERPAERPTRGGEGSEERQVRQCFTRN